MSKTIQCSIVSVQETLFSEMASYIVVTGAYGELGIYPGHSPLLTTLPPGSARIMKANGHEEVLFISGGFLEVQADHVILLADVAIRGGELDEEESLAAKQHAQQELGDNQLPDIDHVRAMKELNDALARLKVISAWRTKK